MFPSSRYRFALSVTLVLGCASEAGSRDTGPRSQAPDGFWAHWADGQAELSGYRLRQPRYGEVRDGEAVLIFVTETFTHGQRVKSDGGHPDEYPVLKLNEVRELQTGIYDYDAMTSVFLRLDGGLPRGVPTKTSLAVQEWCGNVYDQVLADDKGWQRVRHSYFDGEADETGTGRIEAGGVLGDAVPVLIRGLTGDFLAPGERKEVPYLPSLLDVRLAHADYAWTTAAFERSAGTATVEVPAGAFEAYTVTRTVGDDVTTWTVEAAYPHRILGWTRTGGEEAVLTGSMRSKYWEQNGPGGEAFRGDLGLRERRWAVDQATKGTE